jgi:hypothetical protein
MYAPGELRPPITVPIMRRDVESESPTVEGEQGKEGKGGDVQARAGKRPDQTVSGFYVGTFKDSSGRTLLTTRRSTISENEKFELFVYGLTSPVVLQ